MDAVVGWRATLLIILLIIHRERERQSAYDSRERKVRTSFPSQMVAELESVLFFLLPAESHDVTRKIWSSAVKLGHNTTSVVC